MHHLICQDGATIVLDANNIPVVWDSFVSLNSNGERDDTVDILLNNPKKNYIKTELDQFVSIYVESYTTTSNTTYTFSLLATIDVSLNGMLVQATHKTEVNITILISKLITLIEGGNRLNGFASWLNLTGDGWDPDYQDEVEKR